MIIGNKQFNENHTYIMGILNATPDSFSDGGRFNDPDNALRHIEEMIADGADVIDVGGESTRPGYEHISVQEEVDRVAPIIELACRNFDIPVSVDTYKPEVAREAVLKGASLINDIWGFRGEDLKTTESGMADIAAQTGAACCIMQNLKLEDNAGVSVRGNDLLRDSDEYNTADHDTRFGEASLKVISGLRECIRIAEKAGIDKNRIMIDPGIGFGKTYEDNLEVLRNLKEIKNLFEYPMLLGTSRKSVIGLTLNLPANERVEGTLATTARAVEAGCLFVRVHDVKENARFIKMYEKIMKKD